MKDSDMTVAKAVGIFSDIENPEHSDHEKGVAIYIVASKKRRLNDVTKEAMAKVILWLWRRSFRKKEAP